MGERKGENGYKSIRKKRWEDIGRGSRKVKD